jgi:uncharacterized protein YlxP (DUF503 family)
MVPEMPANAWIYLVLQIPLSLVVVYVVIYCLKFIDRTVQSFLTAITKMTENNQSFVREQQQLNRDFLQSQQEQHNASIARIAEEVKANKMETIKEVANLTQRVDNVLEKTMYYINAFPNKTTKR